MQGTLPYRNWLSSTITTTTATTTTMIGDSSSTISSGGTIFVSRPGHESNETNSVGNTVAKSVSEKAIIVVATRGCYMCHVVKNLLLGLGVNPTIFEVNNEDEDYVKKELSSIIVSGGGGSGGGGGNGKTELPAVFVGGNLFGGLERVVSTYISGELVPILKEAGALWL